MPFPVTAGRPHAVVRSVDSRGVIGGRPRASSAAATAGRRRHHAHELTRLAPELYERLAFARQKADEVVLLGTALRDGTAHVPVPPPKAPESWRRPAVRDRLARLAPADRQRPDYDRRAVAQQARLNLPELPTTTVGSFPQTPELRRARAARRAGTLSADGYAERMRAEVEHVIRLQESLGLDVLVHGGPERNDMVQYFGERLDGIAATDSGWVQSHGTRCVRPPLLYGRSPGAGR
jgi:5-methyltetrahydropteroyltriglutamate--homocysteine methyltransferase